MALVSSCALMEEITGKMIFLHQSRRNRRNYYQEQSYYGKKKLKPKADRLLGGRFKEADVQVEKH